MLCNIENCGRLLNSWNIKKRKDMRLNLQSKREALREATKVDNLVSWRVISKLEADLNEVLDLEER